MEAANGVEPVMEVLQSHPAVICCCAGCPHATIALQAGIHPKVDSERLGQATISITLDTNSHAIPAMQEGAAALIAGLVFAAT